MFLLNLDKEDWLHPSHFWLCLLFPHWFISPKQGLPYILTRAISTKRSFSCNVWTTGFQTQSSCLLKANLPGSLVCKMHGIWKDFWLGQGGAFVRSPLLSPCPPPPPALLSPPCPSLSPGSAEQSLVCTPIPNFPYYRVHLKAAPSQPFKTSPPWSVPVFVNRLRSRPLRAQVSAAWRNHGNLQLRPGMAESPTPLSEITSFLAWEMWSAHF